MQSNYEKLRKSGVSNMDAIDIASRGYEATIIRINQVLSKFGIDKFNAANFAGKDVTCYCSGGWVNVPMQKRHLYFLRRKMQLVWKNT